MPQGQQPTTLPDTIEIKLTGTNETKRFQISQKIGEGLFSDVYCVTDDQGNEFALKAIKLDNTNLSEQDRVSLMQVIKKEVGILKQLDMLNGFKKLDDTVLILQPYFKGNTALDRLKNNINGFGNWPQDTWEENNQIIKECFLTLLEVHNKNIVHMDAHGGNFIYSEDNQNRTMIDFGFAQRKNKYNAIEDNAQFLLKFREVAFLNGDQNLLGTLFGYYIDSVVKHIKENKLETALKIFAYGVISVAAIYGLGTFAAAQMLMWAYCKTIALDFVTDWFSCVLERNQAQLIAQKCANGAEDAAGKQFESGVKHGHYIVAALLFWGIYRSYQSPVDLVQKLISLSTENSVLSQAFWSSAFNAVSTLEVLDAALFYYPATNAYKYLSQVFESTFASENSLAHDCDKISQSKGWMSYFNLYQTVANTQNTVQADEELSVANRATP